MLSTPLLNLIALEGNGENSENKKSGRTAFFIERGEFTQQISLAFLSFG